MQWLGTISSIYNVEQKRALVLSGDDGGVPDQEVPPVVVTELADSDPQVQEALSKEKRFVESVSANGSAVCAAVRFLPDGYSLCRVTKNSELVDLSQAKSPRDFKSTRFLEFDLKGLSRKVEPSPLQYQTGDHAKMLPSNPIDIVQAMCDYLELQMNSWVHVKVEEGEGRPLAASVARVSDVFAFELDLATQDKDGNLPFISKMAEVARAIIDDEKSEPDAVLSEELARLENLVERLGQNAAQRVQGYEEVEEEEDPKAMSGMHVGGMGGMGKSELEKQKHAVDLPTKREAPEDARKAAIDFVMDNYVNIPSLLQDFPVTASMLTLTDCIETLPRLKPRHYSIASSSEMYDSSLQLTVGVLDIVHKTTGNTRHGLCSNFLKSTLPQETFVRMGINTSSFRLPSDLSCPIIMVGPGTGISPMLGFLQAREKAMADGVGVGKCMVLFGCRSEADFLHSSQMRKWEKNGVITSLQVAFSRHPTRPKEYVQHRIAKIQNAVWDILQNDKCHYYVCGDSNMAEDVYDELFRTARATGSLSHKEAWAHFQKMKKEHRFQNDTWGVVSRVEEGLARQAEKKYNQAAAWLESVVADENSA